MERRLVVDLTKLTELMFSLTVFHIYHHMQRKPCLRPLSVSAVYVQFADVSRLCQLRDGLIGLG